MLVVSNAGLVSFEHACELFSRRRQLATQNAASFPLYRRALRSVIAHYEPAATAMEERGPSGDATSKGQQQRDIRYFVVQRGSQEQHAQRHKSAEQSGPPADCGGAATAAASPPPAAVGADQKQPEQPQEQQPKPQPQEQQPFGREQQPGAAVPSSSAQAADPAAGAGSSAGGSAAAAGGLTAMELDRLERIRRNQEMMLSMGLGGPGVAPKPQADPKPAPRRPPRKRPAPAPAAAGGAVRRSARARGPLLGAAGQVRSRRVSPRCPCRLRAALAVTCLPCADPTPTGGYGGSSSSRPRRAALRCTARGASRGVAVRRQQRAAVRVRGPGSPRRRWRWGRQGAAGRCARLRFPPAAGLPA